MALDGLDRADFLGDDRLRGRADVDGRWTAINRDIAQGAETAALAAGLHHQAAALIGAIEDEVAAISVLLGRSR